jgi:hypothetical protein
MIVQACVEKPVRVATAGHLRRAAAHGRAARDADHHEHDLPHVPRQRGGQGREGAKQTLSPEAIAMAQMMKGIHF